MSSPFATRLTALQQELHSLNVDAIFVSFLPQLRYLSNFSGSAGLGIVTKKTDAKGKPLAYFITDGRYKEQIKSEVQGWNVTITQNSFLDEVKAKKFLRGIKNVGFDKKTISYAEFSTLQKLFPHTHFIPQENVIEKSSRRKDESELMYLKQAIAITDKTFSSVISSFEAGISERELAAEISFLQKMLGGEQDAFEPIVASGARGALPHARPTEKLIANKELVILDFGCTVNGYHSDMTRTVAIGKITPEMKSMYQVCYDAQQKAIDGVKAGMKAKDLDTIARNYIKKKGFGKYFNHSLGHGVGLVIHESPKISPTNAMKLETGMAITIEPGIYIPNVGGVRIEDIVVVEKDGCTVLTKSKKELITV